MTPQELWDKTNAFVLATAPNLSPLQHYQVSRKVYEEMEFLVLAVADGDCEHGG